jgi:dCMP deaminase
MGATAYVTNMPCTACAKALIAAGVCRVVVFSEYHDTLAERFFAESRVELCRLPMPERLIQYDLERYTSARPCGGAGTEPVEGVRAGLEQA